MWTMREIMNRVFALRRKIEQDSAFMVSYDVSGLASGGSIYILFENPSTSTKNIRIVVVEVDGTAKSRLYAYKNIDTTGIAGTSLQPASYDVASSAISVANIQVANTYDTSTLTPILRKVVAGGSGVRAIGGASDVGEFMKLRPGTNVLFELTNTSASAEDYSIEIKWYEGE